MTIQQFGIAILLLLTCVLGCNNRQPPQSISGIKMQTVGKINTDKSGLTIEQRNIKRRVKLDNEVGTTKHLYILSAYSGQVLIYSTVDGKVTSSGKRLTPSKITGLGYNSGTATHYLPEVTVGNTNYTVDELLGEDGTVGPSIEFLYWWDSQGRYHQHYVSGGQIVHISDQPIAVKSIIINMEVTAVKDKEDK